MKEAQFRAKCNRLLQRLGFWTISGNDEIACRRCPDHPEQDAVRWDHIAEPHWWEYPSQGDR